jgi:hypothetical protein
MCRSRCETSRTCPATDRSSSSPVDAIHDQARPAAVLPGVANAVVLSGEFLTVDIRDSRHPHENVGLPGAAFMYGSHSCPA